MPGCIMLLTIDPSSSTEYQLVTLEARMQDISNSGAIVAIAAGTTGRMNPTAVAYMIVLLILLYMPATIGLPSMHLIMHHTNAFHAPMPCTNACVRAPTNTLCVCVPIIIHAIHALHTPVRLCHASMHDASRAPLHRHAPMPCINAMHDAMQVAAAR